MRRFFVPNDVLSGREVKLPPELGRRLASVLRLKPGERVLLGDGAGCDHEAELVSVSSRGVTVKIHSERPSPPEPAVEVVLYQSLIRPQRFELALEKGTELGVTRFVPLLTQRVEVKTAGGSQRAERWRRIVTEAAEQCGRGRVPAIDAPMLFEGAVASAPGLKLLPWEEERSAGLRSAIATLSEPPKIVSLFIGPEGGISDDEAALARGAGCLTVSLGPRVLRSETAGIVAVALVMEALQGWGEQG
jgi:16S rRNA (uracil1498-N3)-methyltransferase